MKRNTSHLNLPKLENPHSPTWTPLSKIYLNYIFQNKFADPT